MQYVQESPQLRDAVLVPPGISPVIRSPPYCVQYGTVRFRAPCSSAPCCAGHRELAFFNSVTCLTSIGNRSFSNP